MSGIRSWPYPSSTNQYMSFSVIDSSMKSLINNLYDLRVDLVDDSWIQNPQTIFYPQYKAPLVRTDNGIILLRETVKKVRNACEKEGVVARPLTGIVHLPNWLLNSRRVTMIR